MSFIGKVYEIEKKLSQTLKKEKRVKEIEEELKIEEQINNYETEKEELILSKKGLVSRRNETEREIEDAEKELQSIKNAVDSNTFKTQKEIKIAKKTEENLVSKLEEYRKNLNFVLNEIKERDTKIEDLDKAIDNLKRKSEKIKKEYEKLDEELKEERALLNQEFDKVISSLPHDFVTRYLDIRKSFPGGAIEKVDHGFCGNCGVKLPLETIASLHETKGNEIIQCEICGKILYIEEDLT
ncbi:MAG: hypothetical protein K6343_02950 [Caldisericaceae bacterium]